MKKKQQKPELFYLNNSLEFLYTTSKGRETYGWNICTLYLNGRKVASTKGGGYDMKGSCLGQWLELQFPEKLQKLAKYADSQREVIEEKWIFGKSKEKKTFYGMTAIHKGKDITVHLDGACGFESMAKILEEIGYTLQWCNTKSKNSTIYTVKEK